jgi:hypothetical protein
VEPWRKDQTYLRLDGTIERRYIDIPQSELVCQYFRTANRIDIHNQYQQGILAIERTWKTKNWNLRLFQTVMGFILVNCYFAFEFKTSKSPSLLYFTNVVAQAMCADEEEEAGEAIQTRRTARNPSGRSLSAVAPPSQRISHALVKGSDLGVGGERHHGSCRMCKNKHASERLGSVCNMLEQTSYSCRQAILAVFTWRSWPATLLPAFARNVGKRSIDSYTCVIFTFGRKHFLLT